jgi:hypothetical protein
VQTLCHLNIWGVKGKAFVRADLGLHRVGADGAVLRHRCGLCASFLRGVRGRAFVQTVLNTRDYVLMVVYLNIGMDFL